MHHSPELFRQELQMTRAGPAYVLEWESAMLFEDILAALLTRVARAMFLREKKFGTTLIGLADTCKSALAPLTTILSNRGVP
jgi:hypothetical protein